jgi:hypothetical protein
MHKLITELRASEPKFHGVEKVTIDATDEEEDEESDSNDSIIAEKSEPVVLCEFA